MVTADKDGIEELARAVDALFLAMRQVRSAAAPQDRLSVSQQAMLEPLLDESGQAVEAQPVGALAAAAGVSMPTATRMLKQLEGRGVITRTRAAQDERRVLIELTPLGHEQMAELRTQRRDAQRYGLAEFDDEERAEFAAYLRRLTRVIKSRGLH
ncbi:MarR family transcriptional regulator [Nocardia sp. NEAU-G5]|uniref:MarR family transcriptional regulator n=1 Tax=Nocardia albiluteola TaxID=2842303 RepID=A0ABS6B8S1_9NOCA|nr:MarR family transcriptional regulator [Nocardia albiluteola]MBU3062602.1 MarR family transcriptional regulator [Nocardia albiluteola]MBU3065564.1 MarR family transcriptional regulator [Nocardia albiluteola]